jgi:hypothetical protein
VFSGVSKIGYGMLAGLVVDLPSRILAPGEGHDAAAKAIGDTQKSLDDSYRGDLKRAGLNPDSTTYKTWSSATEVAGVAATFMMAGSKGAKVTGELTVAEKGGALVKAEVPGALVKAEPPGALVKTGQNPTITAGELANSRSGVVPNQKALPTSQMPNQKALPSSQMRTLQMAEDARIAANPSNRDVAFAYGRDVATGATEQAVNLRQTLAEIGNSNLAEHVLRMPQEQINVYSNMTKGVGTHAEVRVFDKLLERGSIAENLEIAVLRPKTGEPFIMCPDCSHIIQGPEAITGRKLITPPPQ